MAGKPVEPAADDRANYTYTGGSNDPSPGLRALPELVAGDVRFDEFTKQLYSTDASIYELTPLCVVFPKHAGDIAQVMTHCFEHEIPVLPRGGGTSLAGQSVNEAVVIDCSRYMDELISISPEEQRCVAQPGIVLAELNEAIEHTGLKFAPDPAWADKSTLGGAIGNNSTGAHSLAYGKTDQYIESCDVVLADGTQTTFGWCDLDELADRADPSGDLEARIYAQTHRIIQDSANAVEEAFPDIQRNVSGYNVKRLIEEAKQGKVNVARLLAGSEGTLAIVTAAEIALEPIPDATGVALLLYEDLHDAVADVSAIVDHEPAAVELVDDVLLDLARNSEEFGEIVASLPDGIEGVLLVECYGKTEDEAAERAAGVVADRHEPLTDPAPSANHPVTDAPRRAVDGRVARSATERDRFWKLRKSGLPILLSRTGDEKHIAFIEDTAVPVDNLAEYVADVETVLEDEDTFASFYAHAGPGCLHIRPLVNTKTADGVESMRTIAERVTDLVIEYGGGISGEHGDGRARTEWNRKLYGDDVFDIFVELKETFDPRGLLNPGQVCGDIAMTEHLRFGPAYSFDASIEPQLQWDCENGLQGMVELCHGCGGCRGGQSTTGGTMCPTYRAASEEITSTRGRANLLRQAMSGSLPTSLEDDREFMREVLDLCIGCKGCARDCPSEVDMAKLKAEVTYAHQQQHGVDSRTAIFSNIHRISALGSTTAPVSNWINALPGSAWLTERILGIARERDIPAFRRNTFLDWARDRPRTPAPDTAEDTVVLLPDTVINYHEPSIGCAAAEVLEQAGVAVTVPDRFIPSGRSALSLGRIDLAKERARTAIDHLTPAVDAGATIVALEPSDAVMIQSDYRSLLDSPSVETLANATKGIAEYIVETDLSLPSVGNGRRLTYHGHCHQKATGRAGAAAEMLERAGYDVDVLDSGCCGMAGAFGYEAEHYSMSVAIGDILVDQVDRSDGTQVAAPGASCRTQLRDLQGGEPQHPIQFLASSGTPL